MLGVWHLWVSDVWVDHAQVTELPAVFVSIHSIQTDGVSCFVHQSTVADGEHVATQTGVEGGASKLIRGVTTIIVFVTFPVDWDTWAVGAFKLGVLITYAVELVTGVSTISVSVTLPSGVDTLGAVSTFELSRGAGAGAVPLVPVVATVVVAITQPRALDTQEVVTVDLPGCALNLVAICLISHVTTVVVTITEVFPGDTFAVVALKLVFACTVGGTVEFI